MSGSATATFVMISAATLAWARLAVYTATMPVQVEVRNVPEWVDHSRLLGAEFSMEEQEPGWCRATALLERRVAADVQARLRGVGIGGRSIDVRVTPPLNRKIVRAARTEDARRRRSGSPGFSRKGARLDREGKVSLTPETLALELGKRANGRTVVDACCGAGGNAIGFARAGCAVTAIEIDRARMELAQHNARVYEVAQKIQWRHGDAMEELAKLRGDLLFIDPPWGEDYDRARVGLEDMPFLQKALAEGLHFPRVWLKLPPSFDIEDLPNARAEAVFGCGEGDRQRVKFLLLELENDSR